MNPLKGESLLSPVSVAGRRTSENDADFEQWWQQVPRKVGKAAAAKLYRRIVERREATVEMLTAGILRYAAEVANREERYIAHPSTWLSQGRWNDEPAKKVGTTIDTDGNPVMPPPDRPQRAASRGWMEVAMDGLNRGRP
jgi:hypothetical protein